MYLLIGDNNDPCCQIVQTLLHKEGHTVYALAEPLAGNTPFYWEFDTTRSKSSLRLPIGRVITDRAWQGVLVRGTGEPMDQNGWEPADLAYIQAETRAALIAWLQNLPCPVINRLTADLWFRPRRPLLEWHTLFTYCGLPTLAIQITNDITTACSFADQWSGEITYAPLTSSTRYPVITAQQWTELARLMEQLPVVLLEPYSGTVCNATLVEQQVIWSRNTSLSTQERDKLNDGLRQLAQVLRVDMVQVELLVNSSGPNCIDVHIFPRFAVHSTEEQLAIGKEIVTLLASNSKKEVIG